MSGPNPNHAESLGDALQSVQANSECSEAVLHLDDDSRLCFCHRVDERWAKAVGPVGDEENGGKADRILSAIRTFRLNAKHLDIQFNDNSRWEEQLPRNL